MRSESLELDNRGLRASKIIQAVSSLKNLISTLEVGVKGPTIDDAARMAWGAFHALFRDKILDLTDKFPSDATDSKGEPFWSGHKRFPAAAHFDEANPDHMAFMLSATNLFAAMLRVHPPKPPSELNDSSNRWQASAHSSLSCPGCLAA